MTSSRGGYRGTRYCYLEEMVTSCGSVKQLKWADARSAAIIYDLEQRDNLLCIHGTDGYITWSIISKEIRHIGMS